MKRVALFVLALVIAVSPALAGSTKIIALPDGATTPGSSQPLYGSSIVLNETLAVNLSAQTCAGWGLTTPVGATSCTDNPLTITRTASGSDLTLTYAGTQVVVPGVTYEIVATYTISAASMSSTIGGRVGATYSNTTTMHEYFTAGTNGKHIITFVAASAGTITGISVNAITNTISASEGPIVSTAALTSVGNQSGAISVVTGTKSAGIMSVHDFVDAGSGGSRLGWRVFSGGTVTGSLSVQGVLQIAGAATCASFVASSSAGDIVSGLTVLNASLSYIHADTLNADTAGPPASTGCDVSTEVGRIIVSTRYSATAEYALWACTQTGASTFAWKYATLN